MGTRKRIITVITALVLLAALAGPLLSPTPVLAAYPSVEDVTATEFDSDSTDHNVQMPATVNAGDLLIVLFANTIANSTIPTVTTPTGWTQLATEENSVVYYGGGKYYGVRFSVYYKKATGTEGGTDVDFVTSSSQRAAAQVYRISSSSWHGTTAPEISTAATGNNDNPDPSSLDPTGWGAEDTLWIAAAGIGNNPGTTSYPTNYTNGEETRGEGSGGGFSKDCQLNSARWLNNATSEDPGEFNLAGSKDDRWVAFTIAIRPAAAPEPMDFGDAPDSYGTLLASNGARHAPDTIRMGANIDIELDGQPSPLADGDDLNGTVPDDEDGVILPASLTPGDPWASVTVNGGPSGGKLDAWIDFNGNGAFDHPGEHLWGGTSEMLGGGNNFPVFQVPPDATPGLTYARFRLSTSGSLPPTGPASDGEVEDYTVEVLPGPGINIDKYADEASVEAGQTIHYHYDVTNDTGAGDITGVSVIDDTSTPPVRGDDNPGNNDDTLEDGETWVYTSTYVATMADLNAGSVTNEATADGTAPGAVPVQDKDTETVTVTAPTPAPNPPLAESCGMDVVLVLDSSDSISNLNDIRNPAKEFVDAFLPDNTLIGVVEFDTDVVPTSLDLTDSKTDVQNRISGISHVAIVTEYTNWAAGLTEARKMLTNADPYTSDRNDAEHPDLIILISNGDPNRPSGYALDAAVFAANAAKSSTGPIRIIYVGVDSSTTSGEQVSGPNVGPPADPLDYIFTDAMLADFPGLANVEAWGLAIAAQANVCVGTITIVKEVVGEAPDSDWEFSGTASIGSFSLAAAGGSTPFSGLDAGDYTITETTKTGYTTSVSCDTGESGTNSVTIDLDPGEHVTCTFTNTAQKGSITIVKEVVGEAPDSDWEFSGTALIGSFSLAAAGGSTPFNDLDAGDYTITETTKTGYITSVSCDTGESGTNSVTIDLDPGENVTCTFTNTYWEPGTPLEPVMTIDMDVETPDAEPGGQVTYEISLVNTDTDTDTATEASIWVELPAGFTYASTGAISETGGATRSSINPTPGDGTPTWGYWSIPSGGSVTITFTADVGTGVGPGTYDSTAYADGGNFDKIDDKGTVGQDEDTPPDQDPETDEDVTIREGLPPPAVGGEAYPVNKLAILLPWIAIAMAIIAGSFIVVRRRRSVRLLRR